MKVFFCDFMFFGHSATVFLKSIVVALYAETINLLFLKVLMLMVLNLVAKKNKTARRNKTSKDYGRTYFLERT